MVSSIISHGPIESAKSKAARKEQWECSTWNSEHVTKIIASSGDMIKVVGNQPDKDGKIFSATIHKELLCFFSPYFTAALKGGFSEAKKDTITMELPYYLMSEFVSWLYSGNTLTTDANELLELYAFADEKMVLAFRRSIMTRLIEFNAPGDLEEDALTYVKHVPENSGLFRYLVDYWACVWARDTSAAELAAWDADGRVPKKFFYQALERLVDLRGSKKRGDDLGDHRAYLKLACNYHEHEDEEEWGETCDQITRKSYDHDRPDDSYYEKLIRAGQARRRILHGTMTEMLRTQLEAIQFNEQSH